MRARRRPGFRSPPWLRRLLAWGPLLGIAASGVLAQPLPVAASGTLYVDGSTTNCNNSGPGSVNQPFCTISAAAAAASPGVSVLVNSGTYFENVNVSRSGISGAPISFAPSPGSSVTVTGQLHGFTVSGQSWIVISGFNITGTSGYGILLSSSSHVTVDGNHVSYSGQPERANTAEGIYLTSTASSLIANNTVDHNSATGIAVLNSSINVEVRRNLVYNNAEQWERNAQGIEVESASAVVDYNVVHDNEDTGIQFYPGANNARAYGNVSYNNGDHGIDNLNVTGGSVIGNTVYHNCTSGINVEGTSGNNLIENNIAVDNAVYPAYNGISCNRRTGNIGVYDSAPATTTANYNVVYLTTSGALYAWGVNTYTTLSALQSASGQESHGIQGDPKWANAAAGKFHLLGGSPAIDSADSGATGEPTIDLDGNSRLDDPATVNTGAGPRGYDDRGAFEFQPLATAPSCQASGPAGGAYTVTVCITSPGAGWVVSGATPISFTVSASGTNPGLNQPVLYLDGQYFTQSFTPVPPFDKFKLPTTKYVDGVHTLALEADMKDGFKSAWAFVTLDFANGILTPPINTGTFVPVTGVMPPSGAYVIGAVGDGASGTTNADAVATMIYNWNPSLFLYLGDVYDHGSVGDFYNLYGTSGSHYAMLRAITNPTIGNHEYETGTPAPYFDYWNNVPHFYSFDVAGWHFISLDSTSEFHQFSAGTPQYQWLVSDLAAHTTACTVVYYHRPLYGASFTGGASELAPLWSVFTQYGVKLVINGHEHDYQRWVPLDGRGNPNPTGVTEIVAGAGGNGIDAIISADPRLAFSYAVQGDYGAMRVTLTSDQLRYEFVRTNGSIPDSGTIACSGGDTEAPTVPAGLAATATDQSHVSLTWSASADNVGVTGYTVYRNGIGVGTVGTPGFTDSSLTAGTTYAYTVDAFDAAGNHSSQSSSVSVTTPSFDSQPPTIPGGLAATATAWDTVSLTWTPSTDDVGVTGYTVYRNAVPVATSPTASYTDTGLAASSSYAYTVDAFDAAGNHAAQSSPVLVTTKARPIAYVQSATFATGGRATTATITLSKSVGAGDLLSGLFGQWDATGQVQVSDNVNGSWVRIRGATYSTGKGDVALYYLPNSRASLSGLTITIRAASNTFLTGTVAGYSGAATSPLATSALRSGSSTAPDSGATAVVPAGDLVFAGVTTNNNPGTITPGASQGITFTIRSSYGDSADADITNANAGAQNARFTMSKSGPWYAGAAVFKPTPADTSPPSPPAGLAATNGTSKVTLTWSASTDDVGVTGYTVYREGAVLATVAATSYVDASVNSVATYSYFVDAFDAAGNHSTQAPPVTITTLDWVPPSVPAGLAGTAPSQTEVDLVWSASTDNVGVTGYSLYRDGAQLATLDWTTTGYADTTAVAGATYAYSVDAFDASGNRSANSSPVSVSTPPPPDNNPPSPPGDLAATASSPIAVLVTWTAATDDIAVTGYDVIRDGSVVATVGPTARQYTDTVVAGSTQSYTVDAFDAAGNHSDSPAPISVTTPVGDTSAPSTPSGVSAATSGSTAVNVSWTASTDDVGVAGYDVLRNGAVVGTVGGTTLTFSDSGVTPATDYTYAVDAFDAAGNYSAASAPVSVHVPAQPRFVQARVVTTGGRVASVTMTLGPVAAGDLIVGWFGQYDSSGQVQVSDNVNGGWTRSASTLWKTTSGDLALYYVANSAAAPAGLTITITAPVATYLQGSAAEYSGIASTNPLEAVIIGKGTGTSADSGQTPAVGAGELVYGGLVATTGPGALTPASTQGVTFTARGQSSSGTQAEEDVLSSAAGPQHSGYELGASVQWFMVCAVFRPA